MEPYERTMVWGGIIVLLIGILLWAAGGEPGMIMGWMAFLLAGLAASYLIFEKIKKDSPQHVYEGLGKMSTGTVQRIGDTADDPGDSDVENSPRLPGMALYVMGGGMGMDIHLKDGGTPLNTGAFIEEPIDCAIEIPGFGMYHPCKPQEIRFDQMNAHFRSIIEGGGPTWMKYNPDGRFAENTKFYHASTMISSLKPPSIKAIDEEEYRALLKQRAADHRRTASDAVGDVMTLAETADALNRPREKRARVLRRAERQEQQEEESSQ